MKREDRPYYAAIIIITLVLLFAGLGDDLIEIIFDLVGRGWR